MPNADPTAVRTRIGVFDSGVGGLSVLQVLRAQMPDASWHYVADSAHAPYSDLSPERLSARARGITEYLVGAGAQAIVIACNTATAWAVDALRTHWPALPFIGVEPGLKPALALSRNGRVGVMATPATLASARFKRLMREHGPGQFVHLQACNGLATEIERGRLDDDSLLALVEHHCRPLREAGVDTVVLGCTHYPFARTQIQAALGESVVLVDTACAVARQTQRICVALPAPKRPGPGFGLPARPLLQTSAGVPSLERIAARWLDFEVHVSALPEIA